MSRYRRALHAGGTFFFTVLAYRRQRIFCDEAFRNALHNAVAAVRLEYPFDIDAWVLLPDHLHCIWTLPGGDTDFSIRWMLIKRYVSYACRKNYRRANWISSSKQKHRESTIWQRRFWEHQIRGDDDFARHIGYLHHNPVKHGYVSTAADWPYSTFHRYVRCGVLAHDWAGSADLNLPE